MKRIAKLCFLPLVILLAMSFLACPGATTTTTSPPEEPEVPKVNQAPVITSLSVEPDHIWPSETATVTCLASDPDGDTLTYTWFPPLRSSGLTYGAIIIEGSTLTWQAPEEEGIFTIGVKVDDGNRGVAEGSCEVDVSFYPRTIVLTPVPDESGSLYLGVEASPDFILGDTEENIGVEPYLSFDASVFLSRGHAGIEIQEATLNVIVGETGGKPFWWSPWAVVQWSMGYPEPWYHLDMRAADYQYLDVTYLCEDRHDYFPVKITSVDGFTGIDVSFGLTSTIRRLNDRFQIRLRSLPYRHDFINRADYIEFSAVELVVVYIGVKK